MNNMYYYTMIICGAIQFGVGIALTIRDFVRMGSFKRHQQHNKRNSNIQYIESKPQIFRDILLIFIGLGFLFMASHFTI